MKSLPKRRLSILFGALGGGGGAFFIARRVTGELTLDTLSWALFGFVVGAVVMFLLTLVQLGADSRYQQLRARFPASIVVQTYPSETLDEDLPTFAPWLTRAVPSIVVTMTLVFDEFGLSMWIGARTPSLLAFIPWNDVTEFGVGPSVHKRVSSRSSLDRIILSAQRGEFRGTILLGLERVEKFAGGEQYLPQEELAHLVVRVNESRKAPRQPVASVDPLRALMSSGLEPGVSAWSARRVSQLTRFPIAALAGAIGLVGASFAAMGMPGQGLLLAGVALLVPIIGFFGSIVERRATRREAAAGYTTLNGRELHLMQRHPTAGTILRSAGARPLNDEEFSRLLGR